MLNITYISIFLLELQWFQEVLNNLNNKQCSIYLSIELSLVFLRQSVIISSIRKFCVIFLNMISWFDTMRLWFKKMNDSLIYLNLRWCFIKYMYKYCRNHCGSILVVKCKDSHQAAILILWKMLYEILFLHMHIL